MHQPCLPFLLEWNAGFRMHRMIFFFPVTCHLFAVFLSLSIYTAVPVVMCLRLWLFAFDAEVLSISFDRCDLACSCERYSLPNPSCCVLPKKRDPFSCSCKLRWFWLLVYSSLFSSDRWTVHVLGAPVPTPPSPFPPNVVSLLRNAKSNERQGERVDV